MLSTNIKAKNQLTLDFDAGLAERYGSLRDCIATGVYQRGLKRIAIELDQAPSNLSVQISDDPARSFSVDSFERYIEKTGDLTPIYYLVERFMSDKSAKKDAAMAQLKTMLTQLHPLMKQAGVA